VSAQDRTGWRNKAVCGRYSLIRTPLALVVPLVTVGPVLYSFFLLIVGRWSIRLQPSAVVVPLGAKA